MNNCEPKVLMIGWPRVGPQKPDPPLVRELFGMYAGSSSEMSAVSQYFYNGLLCGHSAQHELGDLFGAASHDAMVHLKRIGQLILQYGGDPRLLSYPQGRQTWWSSGAVSYNTDPMVMLNQAIQKTQGMIEDYEYIETKMEPEPRTLIQRILLDERHYLDLFQCFQHEMTREQAKQPITES